VASVRVKDGDDLHLHSIGDVVLDKLKVENQAGRSPSNANAPILNTVFTFASSPGYRYEGFSETDTSSSFEN
jgi:hypothetical protein